MLSFCREADARGTETQMYLLGRRSARELIVTTVLRAGVPVERAAMTQADYGASAVAMQPYLDRGETLLGEAHAHLGLIGASAGDRRTLLSIPADRFPQYLCVVVAMFRDERAPVVTAHSVLRGCVVDHDVRTIENAYPVLLPQTPQRALLVGAGSGAAAMAPQLAKLPLALTIVDHDRFEARNLERHLATRRSLGRKKAKYLAAYLRPRSAFPVRSVDLEVTPATRGRLRRLIARHDFVINATGHPPTSIILSELCAALQKVCIHAGVFARGHGGMVLLQRPGSACYLCLYDLQQQQATEDAATLALLAQQYGYSEADLQAHTGLWSDVATVATLQGKLVADYLKYGPRPTTPNLYVVDNDQLSIRSRSVQPQPDCTCQEAP